MKNNPGKRLSIYEIPEIVTIALPQSATPKNIMAGFAVSGVWPFNRNAFDDTEFAPAYVTDQDRTHLESPIEEIIPDNGHSLTGIACQPNSSPSTSYIESPVSGPSCSFSPTHIRPFPK